MLLQRQRPFVRMLGGDPLGTAQGAPADNRACRSLFLLGKLSFLCWLEAESINLLTQSARELTRSRRQKVVRAAVHSSTDQAV